MIDDGEFQFRRCTAGFDDAFETAFDFACAGASVAGNEVTIIAFFDIWDDETIAANWLASEFIAFKEGYPRL